MHMRQRKKAEEWQFARFALQTHRNDSFAPWNLYESFPSWLTCCHFFFGTLRQCKSQGCSKFSRPTPGAGPSKRGVTSRHRTHAVSTLDTAVKTIDSHKWEETNNKASLDQPSMSSLLYRVLKLPSPWNLWPFHMASMPVCCHFFTHCEDVL